MPGCTFFFGFLLFTVFLTVILWITSRAEKSHGSIQRHGMSAAAKNRLTGSAIILTSAVVVYCLKHFCKGTEADVAWVESLVTLTTGFGSAVAAVFISEGFKHFRDPPADTHNTP